MENGWSNFYCNIITQNLSPEYGLTTIYDNLRRLKPTTSIIIYSFKNIFGNIICIDDPVINIAKRF